MSDIIAARRPPLAFRVGVTGKRKSHPGVENAIAALLAFVQARCEAVAATPAAKAVYRSEGGEPQIRLTLLSPLAEGADRMAARVGLPLGYRLAVPMPFRRADYETTFDLNGLEDFPELLEQAESVFLLDGDLEHEDWRAYDAVGKLIARNCDLLVGVWDPDIKSDGRGGTEDVVRFAVKIGVPVWLIDPAGVRSPALIAKPSELRHPHPGDPKARLAALIEQRVGLSTIEHRPPHNGLQVAFGRVRQWFEQSGLLREKHYDPLRDFLDASPQRATWVWSGYDRFLSVIAWKPRSPAVPGVEDAWTPLYALSDSLAEMYARRYRSSYIYVLALAALTPILAATESILEGAHRTVWAWATTAAEFLVLLAMLTLVVLNLRGRWHEKWISYRLLAELCRKQQALAKLGWSLATASVSRAVNPGAGHASWIDWLFQAHVRAVPLTTGSLNGSGLTTAKKAIAATLLDGQIAYHKRRKDMSATAARRLSVGGTICFFLVLVLVAARVLAPALHRHVGWAEFALTVVAAISAAFFAVRAYAEFELLADQSERMISLLEALRTQLGPLSEGESAEPGNDDPLASQDLGADLFHLTQAMLQDVSGWAQLFRLKAVEAG